MSQQKTVADDLERLRALGDETNPESERSDVSAFLEELRQRKPRLSSPVSADNELWVKRLRSEWAKTMLEAPQFQESIQLMNEKVLADMSILNPLEDRDKVTVLAVKVQVIQDFMQELMDMCDEWDTIQQIQEQHERRFQEDPTDYDYQPNPLAGALS